jgi:hypothetical protein
VAAARQGGGAVVLAGDGHQRRLAAERRDVVRDVGGAAESELLAVEAHDGHRRFRRNAIDASDDEVIEHHIAGDGKRPAAELRDAVHEALCLSGVSGPPSGACRPGPRGVACPSLPPRVSWVAAA